jgi:IS1 family transposase
MNRLRKQKQVDVISLLAEGCSVRSTERLTGVHRDTIIRLMVRVGKACAELMDHDMRDLDSHEIQVDEQWTFVGKKQRHLRPGDDEKRMGDFWIWSALDADTKLVPTHLIGKRTSVEANAFIRDLAGRLRNRVQISSDALKAYVEAIEVGFGGAVDYGQTVKSYEVAPAGQGKYSTSRVTKSRRTPVFGNPKQGCISTCYIERLHLTNRMRVRRLMRLTDAYSRKLENLKAALQLHYAVYNYVKRHSSLKGATPATAAGLSDHGWRIEDVVDLASWSP